MYNENFFNDRKFWRLELFLDGSLTHFTDEPYITILIKEEKMRSYTFFLFNLANKLNLNKPFVLKNAIREHLTEENEKIFVNTLKEIEKLFERIENA